MPKKKQIPDNELLERIYKLLTRLVSPLKPIPVQDTDSIVLIRPENIAYITTQKSGVLIIEKTGHKWSRYDSLAKIEKRLSVDSRFFRCHRSFILNLELVRAIKDTDDLGPVTLFEGLPDDFRAEISSGNLSKLKKLLGI